MWSGLIDAYAVAWGRLAGGIVDLQSKASGVEGAYPATELDVQ